jgi:hypothetical protein
MIYLLMDKGLRRFYGTTCYPEHHLGPWDEGLGIK